ncbi:acylphosphatase [Kaistia soli DSM 19436]|uniref:acylphosphatase n=1 Tax=Kaistia soli DSM 19436 TaxID=1122133 RepID=A0A1M5H1U4_9HYPH|nr:acylphosphatase [Kaistia soli]SHG09920.1 acylphosphatase [Kaistia soli DSM 19436]
MARRTVQVSVTGRVQGVGYRAFVEQQAVTLGLSGWVRNRRDGSVEALFSGEETVVTEMLDACRRGPPFAAVEAVQIVAEPPATEGPFLVAPSL